ncbi:MAG TPA: hypothetical protein PLI49_26840, partial [Leptospiraceae bacterium]|nr:hypothetical protein [Leptospiraceae bacterium]
MQKIRLRYSHGKLQTKAISAPFALSYFVASFCRLGDIEKMARRFSGNFLAIFSTSATLNVRRHFNLKEYIG